MYVLSPHRSCAHSDLRAEINYLEKRLIEMGSSGDCAYERALAKAFIDLISERRRLLTRIDAPL